MPAPGLDLLQNSFYVTMGVGLNFIQKLELNAYLYICDHNNTQTHIKPKTSSCTIETIVQEVYYIHETELKDDGTN
jgi:hypothetical protein